MQFGGESACELVRVKGDKAHPASQGYTCEKPQRLNFYQNSADRLTSPLRRREDGTLHLCLGREAQFEFRPLLRAGASDSELISAIRDAIELKPGRHEFREQPRKIVRFMSATGG